MPIYGQSRRIGDCVAGSTYCTTIIGSVTTTYAPATTMRMVAAVARQAPYGGGNGTATGTGGAGLGTDSIQSAEPTSSDAPDPSGATPTSVDGSLPGASGAGRSGSQLSPGGAAPTSGDGSGPAASGAGRTGSGLATPGSGGACVQRTAVLDATNGYTVTVLSTA